MTPDEFTQHLPRPYRAHLIPVGGEEPLHLAHADCKCHPSPSRYGIGVWVHNAWDGRERYERQDRDDYPDKFNSQWVTVAELFVPRTWKAGADRNLVEWMEVLASAYETLLDLSYPHATKDNHHNRKQILADTKTLLANVRKRDSVLDAFMGWPEERLQQLVTLGELLADLGKPKAAFRIEDISRFNYVANTLWSGYAKDTPEMPFHEFLRRLAGLTPHDPEAGE